MLVVRESPRGGGVLAATDFSDPALPAVEAGAAEAKARGAALRVVHVIEIPPQVLAPTPLDAWPAYTPDMVTELRQAAEERLAEIVAGLGVDARSSTPTGPAAATIVMEATSMGAELVVLGTRGRTGLSRLALGSTAEGVLRSAPCSVLIVRLEATAPPLQA